MARIRVHELARECGTSSREVVECAQSLGFNVMRAVAQLNARQADAIRRLLDERDAASATPPPAHRVSPVRPRGVMRAARCTCCTLPFSYDSSRYYEAAAPERCPNCCEHYHLVGEDDARVLARCRDHERRVLAAWDHAAGRANEYEDRMKSALQSRQKWKAALVEVILSHDEVGTGGCRCGAGRYPCYTVLKLEERNRGIARAVEQLGTLSDSELERELYPDEPWRSWYEAF